MFEGTVAGLHRWPVKSLGGERIAAARLDGRGLVGDRVHALIDLRPNRAGQALTVRQVPQLLTWSSGYGPSVIDPSGPPVLRAPDGESWSWTDPGLAAALTKSLGIALEPQSADGMQDRGPTVLVTFEASLAALEEELAAPVELDRFRPNVHLAVDAPPFAEQDWGAGTTITIGDVMLEVVGDRAGPCVRCTVPSWEPAGRERWPKLQRWLIEQHENKFGLIMRVTHAGIVRTGAPASARPPL
ncbi:MAG TPA: MOSC N-terminal beta barrel domain-containing protein [Amycolatopsis sp.]|uniref:MOSC domain-containing protein n=1 Tax=Amycolatopsis sp. TaxID=37632 RepID=UPI002B49F3C5|nr:MOSC N-terminal beta barrel domain-containing protein [Amycolatopsis sp.]HKS44802.1 MOSC N-terminal beta barrel domain-containing protein [Amycolatopsis sp.]